MAIHMTFCTPMVVTILINDLAFFAVLIVFPILINFLSHHPLEFFQLLNLLSQLLTFIIFFIANLLQKLSLYSHPIFVSLLFFFGHQIVNLRPYHLIDERGGTGMESYCW